MVEDTNNESKRREILKNIGVAFGGALTALGVDNLYKTNSNSSESQPLENETYRGRVQPKDVEIYAEIENGNMELRVSYGANETNPDLDAVIIQERSGDGYGEVHTIEIDDDDGIPDHNLSASTWQEPGDYLVTAQFEDGSVYSGQFNESNQTVTFEEVNEELGE